jgi:hypothetical protein
MATFAARLKSWFKLAPVKFAESLAIDPLDYDHLVQLDAEDLAEQGILAAYTALRPRLQNYSGNVLDVSEEIACDAGAYSVVADGERHIIWETGLANKDGWERATVVFFKVVNANLRDSEHKFYALYGGNDLSGMFLTDQEFRAARKAIKNPGHWPWTPVDDAPGYGYPSATAAQAIA